MGAKIIERIAKPLRSNIVSQPKWRFERGVKSIDGGSLQCPLSQFRREPERLEAAEPERSKLSERGSRPRCPIDGVALKACSHDEYLAVLGLRRAPAPLGALLGGYALHSRHISDERPPRLQGRGPFFRG